MATDDFMKQPDGVEAGYWAKRKDKFLSELEGGVKAAGVNATVQQHKKAPRTNSKRDIEGHGTKPETAEKNED